MIPLPMGKYNKSRRILKSVGGKKKDVHGKKDKKDKEMEDYLRVAHGEQPEHYTNKAILKDRYYNMKSFRAYTYKYSKIKTPSTDYNEYYNKNTRRSYEPL